MCNSHTFKEIMTDRHTDQSAGHQTDRPGHREVTLLITGNPILLYINNVKMTNYIISVHLTAARTAYCWPIKRRLSRLYVHITYSLSLLLSTQPFPRASPSLPTSLALPSFPPLPLSTPPYISPFPLPLSGLRVLI